jgi:hypothetical protein
VFEARWDDLCDVLDAKLDDLCCVLDNAGELDSRVLSVSRANRSPRGVVGGDESWVVDVDVEGEGEASGEDGGRGRWLLATVDKGRDDLCDVLDAKRDDLCRVLDNAGNLTAVINEPILGYD